MLDLDRDMAKIKITSIFRDINDSKVKSLGNVGGKGVDSAISRYLKIYFDYLYFFGLAPYKFVVTNSGFNIQTSFPRKVLFGLFAGFACSYDTYTFITAPYVHIDLKKHPVALQGKVVEVILKIYTPIWVYTMWRKKSTFNGFLQSSTALYGHRPASTCGAGSPWNKSVVLHGFLIFFIGYNLHPVLLNILRMYGISLSSIAKCDVNSAPYSGYIIYAHNGTSSDGGIRSVWEHSFYLFLYFVHYIHGLYVDLLGMFLECFFPITALTLREIAIHFRQVLDRGDPEDSVLNEYDNVKRLVKNLNDATSSLVLLTFITGVPYYADCIVVAFTCRDVFYLGYVWIWAILQGVMLVVAADAHQKINEFRQWVLSKSRKGKTITVSQMNNILLYMDTSDEPIALRGGRLFHITFGSIGNGLGLLATYVILQVQLRIQEM